MRVELSRRARDELFTTLQFFARERRSLATEFLADFEHALELLGDFPYIGARTSPPLRKLRLRRFRFEVFYSIEDDIILVTGLVHMSRDDAIKPDRVEEVAPDYGLIPEAA